MTDQDLRTYEMFLRVGTFGSIETATFPATSRGGRLLKTIADAGAELAGYVAAQLAGTNAFRAGSSTKATSRAALKKVLDRMRRTARVMALEIPGVDSKFRIPEKPTDQELVGIAKVFAEEGLRLQTTFISYGLPASFLDELNTHLTEFNNALNRQNSGKVDQVTATAAIEDALDRGLTAWRVLDVIVRNTFQDQPAKLAAWQSASHIERAPRTRTAGSPAPSTTPQTPPAP